MRTFVAIKLPLEIIEGIGTFQRSLKIEVVKWIALENIHLTLKFLGETSELQLGSVKSAIRFVLKDVEPFNVSLSGVGGFPNLEKPSVLWIGVGNGKRELAEVITRLNEEFSRQGFSKEGRFPIPHITIGRVKRHGCRSTVTSGGNTLFREDVKHEETMIEKLPTFLVNHIYLIRSLLTSHGPVYTDIESYKL